MAARVISLSEIKEENDSFGQIINDLISLVNHGFETSDAFVITLEAFEDFVKKNNLNKKINHLTSSGAYDHINKHIGQAKLSVDLIKEILNEYKKLGTILEDAEVDLNGEKIKGETSLLEKIRQIFISNFKNNKSVALIVRKLHFGKHGKVRTSSKFVNIAHELSREEIELLENVLSKFKSIFYIPHEIEFTLEKNKVLINKIKPETNVALGLNPTDANYKILKNSAM